MFAATTATAGEFCAGAEWSGGDCWSTGGGFHHQQQQLAGSLESVYFDALESLEVVAAETNNNNFGEHGKFIEEKIAVAATNSSGWDNFHGPEGIPFERCFTTTTTAFAFPCPNGQISPPPTIHHPEQSLLSPAQIPWSSLPQQQQQLRRSSSLKTGKTPPGTPGGGNSKKMVRFADALGLDLADVKIFLDEIPKIPRSAFVDLCCRSSTFDSDSDESAADPNSPWDRNSPGEKAESGGSEHGEKSWTLMASFHTPSSADLFDRLQRDLVLLESANYDRHSSSVRGLVRVRNLDFHKTVFVRHTNDDWTTSTETQAEYVSGSCDGFSDKFLFKFPASGMSKVQFALRFQCKGECHWDNNQGRNYVLHPVPTKYS